VRVQPVILTTLQRLQDRVQAMTSVLGADAGFETPLIHVDADRQGAAIATRDAIRSAVGTGAHVLLLEDDILVDTEAPGRILSTRFPEDVAVISFCDMREIPEFSRDGLYAVSPLGSDGRGWWGNQALLIHASTAAMLARADWFADDIEQSRGVQVHRLTYEDEGRNCSDIRLALLVHKYGGDRSLYAVSVPSVFKHVGYTSVCFPGRGMGERDTRNWIGDRRRFGLQQQLAASDDGGVGEVRQALGVADAVDR
jgi:hypothetical protein